MKLCECGCGNPAPIATHTRSAWGYVKGQATRFIQGHSAVTVPLATRFWAKVNKHGPMPRADAVRIHPEIAGTRCWLWTGCIGTDGYGYMQEGATHRVAWRMATGKWPEPCALHKCDIRACVRKLHLFEGTKKQNGEDWSLKNNGRPRKGGACGTASGPAKLDDEKVRTIRNSTDVQNVVLAKLFGVTASAIYYVKERKTWKHVT
jgi:hypothetical protein